MAPILVLGGTSFDHIVTLPELPAPQPRTIHQAPFHEGTGSTGAGKALALTKLGLPTTLYSAVGDDAYGRHIVADLQAQGVRAHYVVDPAGTERHINLMDARGQRISLFITQSSPQLAFDQAQVMALLQDSACLVLNILSYCKQLIPLLAGYPHPIWTDLHDYDGHNPYHQPFIEVAHYVHLSSDTLPDYRPVMQQLRAAGKRLVVCTHGAAGATLLTAEGQWLEQAAVPARVLVDSNGAGDNFFAGFLYGWLHQEPAQKCLQYGALCGSWCVGAPGLVAPQLTYLLLEQSWQQHFGNA
ncbi:carbohydrate kinase family protein [Hymenobacter sp. BT683]|uniref:Carbohydrate kinase family protein n=1 Tax=Hymenobacter jeongseonensis TaxID=2791027 RepID=A0ABS0IPD9_9BACT|nr:carbohydrate kinase family protein [Hymenobacter jeongseonensis]MBF9239630.1 carbohydrate kinase family protein [Hymenobacter jeongseonensis]